MKLTRNYLTSDEISYIINSLEAIDGEYSREIVKKALIIQMLIDDVDWNQYESCNDMYDVYMAQDDIDIECDVKNYYIIDEILQKENSLEKVVERFLNGLSDKIDEYGKSVDLESLKGMLGELKKLEDGGENEELVVKK